MRWQVPPEQSLIWGGSTPTMGDKSVETLCNKIEFLSILVTFPPFPPKQCWFFHFFHCTDHSAYTTLNWGAGGIRELTLEANKIEQMLKYRKASFPKSVSTASSPIVATIWKKLRWKSICFCPFLRVTKKSYIFELFIQLLNNSMGYWPIALAGYGSIAHKAELNGLLTCGPWGRRV